jgi:ABC transporter substrate binding protein (PQQ-dependent alcohol dehydrogenase system)
MGYSSMNKVYSLLAGFTLTVLSAIWNEPLRAETLPHDFRFVYVERESDPFYDPPPETDGVIRVQNTPPYAGAQLGIKDVQALGRAANATFTLERDTVAAEADIAAEIKKVAASGAAIILLDLPHDDIIAAAHAVPADAITLFNIRDMHDDLRQDLCNTALFHTIPSQTALSDALAQFIVRKNWKRVLTLKGPEAEDEALASNFAISAKKFGAKIIDTKPFIAGNDPRKREQISTALMTGDSD